MRDIKTKLRIIWLLLTDQYTSSFKQKCFWLPTDGEVCVLITFDRKTYQERADKRIR